MELKNIKCPKCGSTEVKKINESLYKCEYCRSEFTADYDEEDVRIKETDADVIKQKQYYEHKEKMKKEENKQEVKKNILKFIGIVLGIIVLLFVIIFLIGIISVSRSSGSSYDFDYDSYYEGMTFLSSFDELTEGDFNDLKDAFNEYAADYKEVPYEKECDFYIDGDLTFETAYILHHNEGHGNKVIFVYKLKWKSDSRNEELTGYIPFEIEDIEYTESGRIKTEYRVKKTYVGDPDLTLPYERISTFGGESSTYETTTWTDEYKTKGGLERAVVKSDPDYSYEELPEDYN